MFGLLKTNLWLSARLLSSKEFRAFLSSSRNLVESLWEEFFRDPSQFYDGRKTKKNQRSPDFWHKRTGKGLWINGFYSPLWVRDKLQKIEIPPLEASRDRNSIIQQIKSCGKKKDISMMRKIHAEKCWITQDIWITNTLIRSYAKCGSMKEAQELFDQLAERSIISWSALIAGYADQGLGNEALACFREMKNDGLTPDSVAYVSTLKACAIIRDLKIVEEIHAQVRDEGMLSKDIVLSTTLVNAYAKCGAVKKAQEVFNQLAERNIVSWNALITGYVNQGLGEEALTWFKEMENDRVKPDSVTYVCTLKACTMVGALEIVKEIHVQVRVEGLLNGDIALRNALVNGYVKCGAVKEAREVLDQLEERDIVSWSVLIAGYVDQGFGEEALACFREMRNDGLTPDSVAYVYCLKACAIVGALETVEEIHAQVKKEGLINKDIALGSALVNAYAKCGAVKEAHDVFNQLVERDVVSWGALIGGYADQGFGEEALACFRNMKYTGVRPDSVAYVCSLKACAIVGALNIVEEIHAQVRDQQLLNKDIVLGTTLVNVYAKCGAVQEARDVFDHLAERNIVSWNALIAGYVDQGFGEEALTCFGEMGNSGTRPDSMAYLCSLKACAIVGALDIVVEIHCQVREQGLLNQNIVLGSALVNAYARCGAVKEALKVFDHLGEQNIESWNALLAGYAQLGLVNEMLVLFNRMMEEDRLPDPITFLVLLNGCSHGALLEEGQRLFYMMGTYRLSLTSEHYTCMVDLFARAGQFDKAKFFVIDDAPTLFAFLGACRKWLNVDLGRWAFEKLLLLDHGCVSAYVGMANIYAAAGMMKEADDIEFLREKKYV